MPNFDKLKDKRGLICQACGGLGKSMIHGWLNCDWCEGTGKMTPFERGKFLQEIKKRESGE